MDNQCDPSATGSSEGGRLQRSPMTRGRERRNPPPSVVLCEQRPDREGSERPATVRPLAPRRGFEGSSDLKHDERHVSRAGGLPDLPLFGRGGAKSPLPPVIKKVRPQRRIIDIIIYDSSARSSIG